MDEGDVMFDSTTERSPPGPGEVEKMRSSLFTLCANDEWDEVVKKCAEKPWACKVQITRLGDTALHLAVYAGQKEILEKLSRSISYKAFATENERGNTPLHLAASMGNVAMCQSILESGHVPSLVGIRNREGETPLFLAVLNGKMEAFLWLADQFCGDNSLNVYEYSRRRDGSTFLHCAIAGDYFGLAFYISQRFWRLVYYVDEQGRTPLHILATKPSAFKSGSNIHGWFGNKIYNMIIIDELKLEREELAIEETTRYEPESTSVRYPNYPANYRTCVNFFRLLWSAVHVLPLMLIGTTKSEEDKVPVQIDLEDPQLPQGLQRRRVRLFPGNYDTCFEFVKLLASFAFLKLPGLIMGSTRISGIKHQKQKNEWAVKVMNELVDNLMDYSRMQSDGVKPFMPDASSASYEVYFWLNEAERNTLRKEKKKRDERNTIGETSYTKFEPGSTMEPIILIAAANGITEMVEKILESNPEAVYEMDSNKKNVVLVSAEQKQSEIFKLLVLKKKTKKIPESVFCEIDNEGNNALHLAAKGAYPYNTWPVPGAAFQLQWEVKWFEYIQNSLPRRLRPLSNNNGDNPQEVFTKEHRDLVKDGGQWLTDTSNACSVVAGLFVTVAFTTSTSVPGGLNQEHGNPLFEQQPEFHVFAISSLVSFYSSLIAVVMFLAILTSGYSERSFLHSLPTKLFLGLTAFYISIASTLISFSAGHSFIFRDKMKSASFPVYLGLCLLVTLFAMAEFRLYFHLAWAILKKVPQRRYSGIFD